MTNPKPFYELPKPPRKRYGVVVVELPDKKTNSRCMQIKRNRVCNEEYAETLCRYCGLPTCDNHITVAEEGFHSVQIKIACQSCAALPPDVREAVRAFREQVNRS